MDHTELAKRIEKRLDKIEEKIDSFVLAEQKNTTDISWIKGYLKISFTVALGMVGGLVKLLFKDYHS